MTKILFISLFLACGLAIADESGDDIYENQCQDQAALKQIDDLLKKVPNDPLVIRTYALRLGLCQLIQEKKISLETGIQVFATELRRVTLERGMEEAERKRKKPVSVDDLEPMG